MTKVLIKMGSGACINVAPQVEVTPEMAAAVEEFNCYFEADPPVFFGIVKDIYRAMHAAAPSISVFTPTEADVESLATALAASSLDLTFSAATRWLAKDTSRSHWITLARVAFDHPGYLPSIVAARRDANESRAAEVAQLRAERDQAYADMRHRLDEHEKVMEIVSALDAEVAKLTQERDSALEVMATMADSQKLQQDIELTLRAELTRAHDLLAQRPATVPETPKPADFTRDFSGDLRRMGR